jgi:hypothetical protein
VHDESGAQKSVEPTTMVSEDITLMNVVPVKFEVVALHGLSIPSPRIPVLLQCNHSSNPTAGTMQVKR